MLKFRFLWLFPVIIAGCRPSTANHFPKTISAEITNPISMSRRDVAVSIPTPDMPTEASFVVRSNEVQLAAQRIKSSVFLVLDSMKANEKRTITIYYNDNPSTPDAILQYRKRTQAEGSGIESEKIAYRFSPGNRNIIDAFGKKTLDLVLMGIDDHSPGQSFGMDIIKMEGSMGLGSIGIWDNDHVEKLENNDSTGRKVEDGLLFSSVTTEYPGIVSELSIH
ncbi:MAG TPA: DUF4861 family protein, partial [Cyclobacteriaceae bacterium]